MLNEGNIMLRPLIDNDANELAELANNKNIWDNVRDFFPNPYGIKDAIVTCALFYLGTAAFATALRHTGFFKKNPVIFISS